MAHLRYLTRHPLRGIGLRLRDLADWVGLWDRIPHRHRMRIWKLLGLAHKEADG